MHPPPLLHEHCDIIVIGMQEATFDTAFNGKADDYCNIGNASNNDLGGSGEN